MAFGEWLYQKRTAARMSQEELADKAGCSRNYISHLERNAPHTVTGSLTTPSRPKVEDLARALGVSVTEALRAAGYSPHPVITFDNPATGNHAELQLEDIDTSDIKKAFDQIKRFLREKIEEDEELSRRQEANRKATAAALDKLEEINPSIEN